MASESDSNDLRICGQHFKEVSTAQGSAARCANVRPPNSDEKREIQYNLAGHTIGGSGPFRETPPSLSTKLSKNSGKRKRSVIQVSSKKFKSSSTVEMPRHLREFGRTFEDEEANSIGKYMEILNVMTLEMSLYVRAAIHLGRNPNMRQCFIRMLPEMRCAFLASIP